jgi:hypothetical protein
MQTDTQAVPASKAALRAGWTLTTLAVLFLAVDAGMKLAVADVVRQASAQLEIPVALSPTLGAILLMATVLYAIPQTAFLGAIVLTGYLGGATWTHVRMGGDVFPMVFPSLVAAFVWGGLYLREPRLRSLVPLRSRPHVLATGAEA